MELNKDLMLTDAKTKIEQFSKQDSSSFDLLMKFFASSGSDLEKQQFAKDVYECLGWSEDHYDVINSFWTTFLCAMHCYYPNIYKVAPKGNVKIYKNDYGYSSFPKEYNQNNETVREQVSKLITQNPQINDFAALCHCVANFMPCPDGDFNSAKGTSKAKDYLPLMIDLIQDCINNKKTLAYDDNKYIIEADTLSFWRDWFIANREKYCLTGYYEVKKENGEEIIQGIPLFKGQTLENPFPKSKEQADECIRNMLKRIDERAELLIGRFVWKIGPSIVERYFAQGDCLRCMAYSGIDDAAKEIFGFAKSDNRNSQMAKSGNEWEQKVLETIKSKEKYSLIINEKDKYKKFSEKEFVDVLNGVYNDFQKKQSAERVYIYQAGMMFDKSFVKDNIPVFSDEEIETLFEGDRYFKMKSTSYSYSDLIRIEWDGEREKVRLSVIDVKLSRKPKVEHKIQIAMYVLLLSDMLKRYGVTDNFYVDEKTAYLFNFGHEEECPFELQKPVRFLKHFLKTTVPELISCIRESGDNTDKFSKLPYRIGQSCEWCDNYEKCIEYCKQNNEEIMLLPNITPLAQDYIRKLKNENSKLEFSNEAFDKFCRNTRNIPKLKESSFWKRFLVNREKNLKMLSYACKGEFVYPEKRKTVSFSIPEYEDVQIILTAQSDFGYDKCYYWGITLTLKEENPEFIKAIINSENYVDDLKSYGVRLRSSDNKKFIHFGIIVKDMSEGNYKKAESIFAHIWHNIIHKIDSYNRNNVNKLTVQHYVMDSFEKTNIEKTLMDILSDPENEMWDKASDLMFVIQGKTLVENTDYTERPENAADHPVAVIMEEIGRLFILPSVISNSVTDLCNNFFVGDEEAKKIAERVADERFINKRSNMLKSDMINSFWNENDVEKKKKYITDILFYMRDRLKAGSLIIEKVREQKHDGIFIKPTVFYLPERLGIDCAELKYLYFEAVYEQLLKHYNDKRERSAEFEQVLENGKVWIISKTDMTESTKWTEYAFFKIENSEQFYKESLFEISVFKYEENTESTVASQKFDSSDINNSSLFSARFLKFKRENDDIFVGISVKDIGYKQFQSFKAGQKFIMIEKVTEDNLVKIRSALDNISRHQKTFVVHPDEHYRILRNDFENVENELKRYGMSGNENFTFSQSDALKQLYENNITLLLGPPGTGKTNFIARAIIAMVRLYKERENKNLRILVCANSHSAIENVLIQTYEMQKEMGINYISLYKLGRMESSAYEEKIPDFKFEKNDNDIFKSDTKSPLVIGSTVWKVYNTNNTLNGNLNGAFDIIIIDEASQVRMVDSVIPVMLARRDTRLLIVGDENQLPPIITGQYEKDYSKPYLLGSVFRYYYDYNRFNNMDYVRSLDEQFRMNNIICNYSAEMIYGTNYRAFNDTIGSQTFKDTLGTQDKILEKIEEIYPGETDNPDIAKIIDPEYPLVLCCVGGETADEKKKQEVKCVTKIVNIFQNLLKESRGNEYTRGNFWGTETKDGECGDFGIVSPHHEHIRKLRKSISALSDPFGKDDKSGKTMFIGTVDKLQGQEREAVIVSYGVTDTETALNEKEFIFSKNRLNVAITRAKKKCIVFLTDAVMSYPIQALSEDDQELLEGLDYVCSFRDYMASSQINTKSDEFKMSDGSMIIYRKRMDN